MIGVLLFACLIAHSALSQEPPPAPDRPLTNPAQEARAQALFDDIRCVVCQHEAIADSPAGVAGDMRRFVRERIAEGETDAEVRADLVDRYGDFVLFKPPVRLGTVLLWFGPALGVLLAIAAFVFWGRRRRRSETERLSPDEETRLAEILAEPSTRRDVDANGANP